MPFLPPNQQRQSTVPMQLAYILFEKYFIFLALETASPGNRHCASCIGTLSLPRFES